MQNKELRDDLGVLLLTFTLFKDRACELVKNREPNYQNNTVTHPLTNHYHGKNGIRLENDCSRYSPVPPCQA